MTKKIIKLIVKNVNDIKKGGYYVLERKIKYTINQIKGKIKKILKATHDLIFFFVDYPRQRWLGEIYTFSFVRIFDRKKYEISKKKNRVKLYTIVYGKHVVYLEKVLLKSLFSENNIKAILDDGIEVELRMFTLNAHCDEVKKIVSDKIAENNFGILKKIDYKITAERIEDIHLKSREIIIKECLVENSAMIMALPDFYFGNGSLLNLIKLGLNGGNCIAGMHLRVNDEEFVREINDHHDVSNVNLVKLTLKHKHQNTVVSFSGDFAGFKITQIESDKFIVEHRVPNIWLANFEKKDLLYFKNRPFQAWDHQWPTSLILESRYKLIGSTDLFFVAEVTEKDSHIVDLEVTLNQKKYNTEGYMHKVINNTFLISMSAK